MSTTVVKAQTAVAVDCVDPADIPNYPTATPIDLQNATPEQKAAAVAADIENFRTYATAMKRLIAQCTSDGAPQ